MTLDGKVFSDLTWDRQFAFDGKVFSGVAWDKTLNFEGKVFSNLKERLSGTDLQGAFLLAAVLAFVFLLPAVLMASSALVLGVFVGTLLAAGIALALAP